MSTYFCPKYFVKICPSEICFRHIFVINILSSIFLHTTESINILELLNENATLDRMCRNCVFSADNQNLKIISRDINFNILLGFGKDIERGKLADKPS